jgi:hypothetical protein
MDHPTASWEAMQGGNVFYRRQQLYSVARKFPNLADYVIAGCRYGGPLGLDLRIFLFRSRCLQPSLAFMRDTSKLVALGPATPAFTKAQLQIYSLAGEGLLLFSVDIWFWLARTVSLHTVL